MFTNEFEYDATVTTVLDQTGEYEDVKLVICDENVVLVQEDDLVGQQAVIMSHQQWFELLAALDMPAGSFYIDYNKK
jgi:hypothetical protein